jgi:Mu-like prophage I protein
LANLSYFIDLRGVELSEKDLTWLHAMPVGTYDHPVYGELTFTSERIERFADNVKKNVRQIELDLDYNHKQDASKGAKAAGWIKDAEARSDGLWIGVAFTDTARAEIEAGEWKYLSPEFQDEWTDAKGNKYQDVLLGAGLTNRPFLKDLLPIAASEEYVEQLHADTTDPKQLHDGYFKVNDRVKHVDNGKVGKISGVGGRAYEVTWDGSKDPERWVVDGELAPETPGKGEMFYSELEQTIIKLAELMKGAKSGV